MGDCQLRKQRDADWREIPLTAASVFTNRREFLTMKFFPGIFLILLLLPSAVLGSPEREVTLQLPWLHQFQFAGYYAALEQGYYKEAGFDVTIQEGKPGLSPLRAVSAGHAEFGVSRSEILIDRAQGSPVVLLASVFQHSAIIFLCKKESGIFGPRDMAGKRVMLLEGANAAEYLAVFKIEGIKSSDYIRLPSSFDINDLINDKTDVFNAYSTNEPFFLQEKKIPYNIIRPEDFGIDFYGDVLFTSEYEIAHNNQQVKAFREASLKGWNYALDHQEEIIDLLMEQYGVKQSRKHMQFEADGVRELILQDLVEIGYTNPDRWSKIAEILADLGMIQKDFSLDGFFYKSDESTPIKSRLGFLNEEEIAYLKDRKVIRMCNNPNWAPIEFAKDGDLNVMQGIAMETMMALEKKLNIRFTNVPTESWSQSQQFLKEKRCDILPCAVKTSVREIYANFTEPYLNLPLAIFTTKDKKVVSGLDEIMDKPWTRQKGSGLITKLKEDYPDMQIIETKGDQEALQYVNSGRAYFTISTLPVASHVISKFMLNDLHIAGYTGMVYNLSMAVRDDDKILLSILNKALADIPKETSRKNFKKWVSASVKEPVPDYKLMMQVLAVAFIIVIFFIYRQRILNNHISILKKAENRTNAEKERLLVTLQSIGDGVITTDLEGNILLINKISENLTGWTQPEAFGRPIQEVFNVVHELTGERCENPVEKVLAKGEIVELANHTALIARDGTKRVIEDSAAPIFNEQSNIVGIVLVYRDVTEERKTKEELIKAKKLESVGVLAGGIAHDFNNILAAILGNIELASFSLDQDNEAFQLLQEAQKASLRAKDLTQQLLTFARGGNPVKRTASIVSIITDSANFVLHGSSVVCHYEFPEDLWKADVDAGQISQVIQNIIINGRQSMPDGGVIQVTCENISDITKEMVNLPQKPYLKINITDTGSGIPKKFLTRIFDPYFTTKHEGSGLGLAICHSIIRKHDGHISVVSKIDQGTRFTIFLPSTLNATNDPNFDNQDGSATTRTARILVMDDEAMIRKVLSKMLEGAGHEVLLAKNGQEVVEIYAESCRIKLGIDLVILDLTIPGGMGGEEAVVEILKIDGQAQVIVASGYSNDPVMANCQEYGFRGSISKPFKLSELNLIIESILDKVT